jgi:hypothetical protein
MPPVQQLSGLFASHAPRRLGQASLPFRRSKGPSTPDYTATLKTGRASRRVPLVESATRVDVSKSACVVSVFACAIGVDMHIPDGIVYIGARIDLDHVGRDIRIW